MIDATLTTTDIAAIQAAAKWEEAAKPLMDEYHRLDQSMSRLYRAYLDAKANHDTNAYPELLCAHGALEAVVKSTWDRITDIRDSYIRDQLPALPWPINEEAEDNYARMQDALEAEVITVQEALGKSDEAFRAEFGSAVLL